MIKLLQRLFGASEGPKIRPPTNPPIETPDSLQELRKLITDTETRPAVLQTLRELNKTEPLEGGYRCLFELLESRAGMEKGIEEGLEALLELSLGKRALAESIIGSLASDKDLAPELGAPDANQDERMVLNLWGVTLSVMRGVPNVPDEGKHLFLDQYHEFIYSFVSSHEGEEARLGRAAVSRISALAEKR